MCKPDEEGVPFYSPNGARNFLRSLGKPLDQLTSAEIEALAKKLNALAVKDLPPHLRDAALGGGLTPSQVPDKV